MSLEVAASGTISTRGSSPIEATVGTIVSNILKAPRSTQPVRRSAGPSALLAKLRYNRGGESNTVSVGVKNTFTIEQGEYGRLLFGVDRRYSEYSNGSFTVKVRW
jgi:hypothetical protein